MGLMQQFGSNPQPSSQLVSQLSLLRQMLGSDPGSVVQALVRTNPDFARFYEENRGKTPEQAFSDNGIDISQVRQLLR
jgi:hypothetical protein